MEPLPSGGGGIARWLELVAVAVASHETDAVLVVGFDVPLRSLDDKGSARSDGQATSVRTFEFAFRNNCPNQVSGLKPVDELLAG